MEERKCKSEGDPPKGAWAPTLAHSRYPWGFAVQRPAAGRVPEHWARWRLGPDREICFDSDQPMAFASTQQAWTLLLGLAVDTRNPDLGEEALARFALSALEQSEQRLWQMLDSWSGRYLLLYGAGGAAHVLNDACGMRTVFYTKQDAIHAASHANILREQFEPPRDPRIKAVASDPGFRRGVGHYPGDLTPWQGIRFLLPNHVLDLRDGSIRRYFPQRDRVELGVNEAAERVSSLLRQLVELLSKRAPLMLSLSAGWDTRVSLAAVRDVADRTLFFTYHRPGSRTLEIDRVVAGRIAEGLSLSHRHLEYLTPSTPEHHALLADIRANTFLSHGHHLALSYRENLPPERFHVRSSYLEIGRAFYQHRYGSGLGSVTPSLAAHLYKQMSSSSDVVAIFERFLHEQDFNPHSLRGYPQPDMFYWEHRMGVWNSCVLLESDIAHYTVSLFNHRQLLDALLSVSPQARYDYEVPRRSIERLWPEVLDFPINAVGR